jgi:3-methyladenine DNA glycosylase AlkD
MTAREIRARLQVLGDAEIAKDRQRFFKNGPGQYGEGDVFLGIKVLPLRKLAREYRGLPLAEAEELLHSPYHEARLLALLILVGVFARGDEDARKAVYDLYLANTARVNNWDPVDTSAGPIVGGYLADRDRGPLYRLAGSASLWERRIAIVGTFPFIRRGDFADTLKLAGLLLGDREGLIHKAVGWMLREVGKRDLAALEAFLGEHHPEMPRTMLRYAVERLPEPRRRQYLKGEAGRAGSRSRRRR